MLVLIRADIVEFQLRGHEARIDKPTAGNDDNAIIALLAEESSICYCRWTSHQRKY